uniref:BRO n=1 Tax=Spodoptera frugiperda nuclear polyhedrosis virus TaxID=10455 RepID=B2KX02_NPVSF|nr:BRO-A [Spodoptera frugiperda multiple nucleopolyhedrovirus]ADV91302.1 bro [Spodoptera frugiperda multiple nucleopolyhedrovirus]AFH59094.1 bro [Spodoptera frugiperda multiple nucleopolyhedrovirus]QED40269.1 BRO-A [Spodoptera frugiperda multiple nucleopolyhedrovirus]QRN46181.1 BRO [Spodoptera frugiperda multiple nucleopolyhedrovirus]
MASVKINLFKFGDEEIELRYVIGDNDEVFFVGKDIATMLKYENTKKAIIDHVDDKYKIAFGDIKTLMPSVIVNARLLKINNLLPCPNVLYVHPQTIMINKSGVIQLIMKSKLSYAVELQEWMFEEVIPQVLCTGKYSPQAALTEEKEIVKHFQVQMKNKDEQVQNLIVQLSKVTEHKNAMIEKLLNNVNNMYTKLQDTVSKTNEIMLQKDKQINKLLDKLDDVSERVVQYPADDTKMPMICIAKNNNDFEVIVGQQKYVRAQKLKRKFYNYEIIVESKRPNPMLDWTNVTQSLKNEFSEESLKKKSRSLSFTDSEDAERFKTAIQKMLTIKKCV